MPFNFEDDVLGPASALPDANSGDPVADQFTWEDNPLAHPAAMVPTPDELAGANGTPPTSNQPPVTVNGKVSASTRGMTQGGLKKSHGLFDEADARTAEFERQDAAKTADQIGRARQGYGDLRDAQSTELDAISGFDQRDRELSTRMADFQQHAAAMEQQAAAMARAEREQYLSAYKEQLAGVKILAMQSGSPYETMSKGESIGLAAAQFAQGFLAARGVNIDVAGQVDRWVERSMRAHQQKVQNMRASAEDQLHMYEIARQSSQDDYEARQRYRGFVIAGLQASIDYNGRRFQSDIAMAHAREQNAKLQIEADATERAIGDAHETRVHQNLMAQNDRAYKTGSLAIESAKLALEREKAAREKEKKAPPKQPTIADPEPVMRNGQVVKDAKGNVLYENKWRVKAGLDDKVQKAASDDAEEARLNYDKYRMSTNRLMNAYGAAHKAFLGLDKHEKLTLQEAATLDESGAIQEFLTEKELWVAAKLLNDSGKSATNDEYKRKAALAYSDSIAKDLFGKGNEKKADKVYARLSQDGIQGFEAHMRDGRLEEIPEDDPDRHVWRSGASPVDTARNGAAFNGEDPETTPMQVEEAQAREGGRDLEPANGSWFDFQATLAAKGNRYQSTDTYTKMPEWAKHMNSLASVMVDPEYRANAAQMEGGTEQEVFYKAYSSLSNMLNDESLPADRRSYANYLFDQAETNTDSLHERMRSAPDQRVPLFK